MTGWLSEDRCVASIWLTVLLSNCTLHRVAFNRCVCLKMFALRPMIICNNLNFNN